MPLRRSQERKAEVAAMFAREEEQAVARQQRYAEEAALNKRVDVQMARELRTRVDRWGYNMHDNYGVTANGDGTVTIGDPRFEDSATVPFAAARAEIETPANARARVTATRVAALGILALAVPKTDKRLLLVITSGGTEVVNLVDGSDAVHLRKWVAAFNTQAASLGSQA